MTMKDKIISATFIIALVITWGLTAKYKDAVWQTKLTNMEAASAKQHNMALQAVLEREHNSREKAQQLEVAYHDQARSINELAADNRRLADELGMRDPYICSSNAGTTGGAASNTADSSSAGRLSKQATQFLLDFAEDADRMSAYAWTCYRWVNREQLGAMEAPPQPTKMKRIN